MKITFLQYILLGIFGVFVAANLIEKQLQFDFVSYKGTDRTILTLTRDMSQEGYKYGPRVFTLWNVSHIVYFALGAYLFPDKAGLLWLLGIAWEIAEIPFGIANFLDIVWNTIGIFIGLQLARR